MGPPHISRVGGVKYSIGGGLRLLSGGSHYRPFPTLPHDIRDKVGVNTLTVLDSCHVVLLLLIIVGSLLELFFVAPGIDFLAYLGFLRDSWSPISLFFGFGHHIGRSLKSRHIK